MSTSPTNASDNLTNKRFSKRKLGLDPEHSELEQTSKAKKLKPYKMSTADQNQLMNFISRMQHDIENKISSSQTSIETKIIELTTTVNTEIHQLKKSFDDLKTSLGSDIDTLKQQVTEHNQRLANNEDDINRLKLSADLRLNGIPFNQGENLVDLFHKIAKAIGYDANSNNNIPLMKRILVRNKITGNMIESSIISFHFSSTQLKHLFYSLYLNKMPLKPETIGLPNDLKIIIGESLTRNNAQIFKYAQNLKKENKIAQAFTADGLVKVKFVKGPNQRTHIIRNTIQLDILLKEHERKLQQAKQTDHAMDIEQAPNAQQSVVTNDLNASSASVSCAQSDNGGAQIIGQIQQHQHHQHVTQQPLQQQHINHHTTNSNTS